MVKNKLNLKQILLYVATGLALLAHVFLVIIFVKTLSYKNLIGDSFYFIFAAILCLLLIIDVVLYFSYKHKMKSLIIIALVASFIFAAIGGVGLFAVQRVNKSINGIVDTEEETKKEVIRVAFATYNNSSISSINDLSNKTVGSLFANAGISSASVGRDYLSENGIEPKYKDFSTTSDLFQALVEGDIDAAIFSNVFKTQLSNEGFDDYLEDTNVFETYEAEVTTTDEETSKKDITVEPFTVLLIGYAPEAGGGGLTDTIILASVNPKTMEVLLTSIPRDSYVPISCYGGAKSKINDAGAASNACLMQTVEDLMGVNVDFYMKVNFQGVVDIVDAIGGIDINSPVEFVGQDPSSERGHMTVWVPKGFYHADGKAALAFARERHHMPNGDFDRQIHQQQVIEEIAKELVNMNSVTEALKVLDAAGENFSTNLSIEQLTSVFNYIVNAPNYNYKKQFSMIDIMNSRLTGYEYWFYSNSMRLPLWSYRLFNGSISQNAELSKMVLNEFSNTDDQLKGFNFWEKYPYVRGDVYDKDFNEPREESNMPAYYPNLKGMTYAEAIAWANANGVKLEVTFIKEGEPGYDANMFGYVVAQNPRYGALVSEYPTGSITVMGKAVDPEYQLENLVGKPLSYATKYCKDHNIKYETKVLENKDKTLGGIVATQSSAEGSDFTAIELLTIEYYEYTKVDTSKLKVGVTTKEQILTWAEEQGLVLTDENFKTKISSNKEGTLVEFTCSEPQDPRTSSTFIFYLSSSCSHPNMKYDPAHADTTPATYTETGLGWYVCPDCGYEEKTYVIPMLTCELGSEYDPTTGQCKKIETGGDDDPPVDPVDPPVDPVDPPVDPVDDPSGD